MKNTLTIFATLLVFLIGTSGYSQTMSDYLSNIYKKELSDPQLPAGSKSKAVLIDEDFEGDELPEGWMTHELGENGSWLLNLGLGNSGSHSMKHAQVAADADNWLVSPQVYIDADNYQLSFYYFCALWEDNSTNILVSSGSGDPADGEFVLELAVGLATWWEYNVIDLSAYEGDSIYVGFQAVAVTAAYSPQFWIDDVYVAPSSFTDGGLILTAPQGYSPDTGVEDINISIENHGTETINGFDVDWWVNGEQQTMYSGTAIINSGNTINVTIGEYDFDEEANYTIEAEIIIADDDDPSNNYSSIQYSVGLSNDLEILSMSPSGNSPFNTTRDMVVEVLNNGTSVIYDFDIEWEVDGTAKPTVEILDINLQPGETQVLIFEDNYFPDGIHTIWVGIPIDFDLTPENNEIENIFAVGGLYEDFQGQYPPDQWRTTFSIWSNWDPQGGDPGNYYAETMAGANIFGVATDTTWTPRLDISAGDELNFMLNSGTGGSMKIVYMDPETGVVEIVEDDISVAMYAWDPQTVDLSVAEGQNYIGFVNDAGFWAVMNYDDVTSTAPIFAHEFDLALFDQSIDNILQINTDHKISCRVKNVGEEDIAGGDYTVSLMEANSGILSTLPGVGMEAFDSRKFEFDYNFINQGNYELYIKVNYSSDSNMTNNEGQQVRVHVVPNDTEFPIIGSPDYPSLEIPFNTLGIADGYPYGDEDFSQVLYYSDEIGTPGMIRGIKYFYKNIAAYGSVTPLKVWIAETDLTEFEGEEWYPMDEFLPVFDDTVYTTAGDGYIYVQFEEPYLYDGTKHLILQHYSHDPSFLFAPSYLWATLSTENVRVNVMFDRAEIDLENLPWPFATRTDYPYSSFVIEPMDDIGVISGIVYDENNNPVSDAEITVEGTTILITSEPDGSYALPPLSYGTHSIKVDKYGYDYFIQAVDLDEAAYSLDFYLEPRPQITVSGYVVGSNDNLVPLQDVVVLLSGYSYYASSTTNQGDFNVDNVYGNETYQIRLELYGYETYIDSILLADENIDLGTLILQEKFIPAVNVIAEDNDTEAALQWIKPGSSQYEYLVNDMNQDMGGLANEPYEEVWLGNRFENEGIVTLTDADIFFTFDEGGLADSVTVDIFNEDGEVITSTKPFLTPWYDWVYLDLPNMTITGDFYIMVHWKNNENTTHFLSYDYDWDQVMPNTAYIKYPDEDLILLGDYFEEFPTFSFWVRAHVLKGNGDKSVKSAIGYNVYRGFTSEMNNVEEWTLLNEEPVTETFYTDETWPPIGVNSYMYAVEALYAEADAEVTFSNSLEGGIVSIIESGSEILFSPNPVRDVIRIQCPEQIQNVYLLNAMGQVIGSKSTVNASTCEFDLGGEPAGVYYLRIETEKGIATEKIVKQ